jgi:hypothetical protein
MKKNKNKIAKKNNNDEYRKYQKELTKQPYRKQARNDYLKVNENLT